MVLSSGHPHRKGARIRNFKQGRTFSRLSFRSLRHTFTSALANAGIPAEMRQKLTGHADAGMHQKYTHLELQPLKQAIATLPSLLNGKT